MGTTKRILIADDASDLREGLLSIFQEKGYELFGAHDGIAAADILKNYSIDLLITDILMPNMDGIELAHTARELRPDIKIIIISGGGSRLASGNSYSYLDTTQKLIHADRAFKKPFDPEEMIMAVEELLIV